jgi:hypothetical protein
LSFVFWLSTIVDILLINVFSLFYSRQFDLKLVLLEKCCLLFSIRKLGICASLSMSTMPYSWFSSPWCFLSPAMIPVEEPWSKKEVNLKLVVMQGNKVDDI